MTLCAADTACRGYNRTTNVAADADHGTPFCRPCLDTAARDVALLAHDWRDLEQLLPKPISQWDDGQPRGSGDAPIPLQLGVEALQADIWRLATTWAEVIADVHHLADPPRRRPSPLRRFFASDRAGQTHVAYRPVRVEHPSAVHRPMRPGPADVVRAVATLEHRVDALARVPAVQLVGYPHADDDTATRFRTITLVWVSGAQGVLDLSRAHQRARAMLGLTEPVYVLPGYCRARACGRPALRVKDGSDTVWCDHCGARMTRDDYDRYGNLFLRPKEAA